MKLTCGTDWAEGHHDVAIDLYGSEAVHHRAVEDERREAGAHAQDVLDRSRMHLVAEGHRVDITLVHGNPIDACVYLAVSVEADELVVMVRSRRHRRRAEGLDRVADRRFGVRAVRYLMHS